MQTQLPLFLFIYSTIPNIILGIRLFSVSFNSEWMGAAASLYSAFVSAACAGTAIKHPRRTVAHKSLKFDLQGMIVAKMWQSFTVS